MVWGETKAKFWLVVDWTCSKNTKYYSF